MRSEIFAEMSCPGSDHYFDAWVRRASVSALCKDRSAPLHKRRIQQNRADYQTYFHLNAKYIMPVDAGAHPQIVLPQSYHVHRAAANCHRIPTQEADP